jgi:hypothetical protein
MAAGQSSFEQMPLSKNQKKTLTASNAGSILAQMIALIAPQ